jgi:hypothetical protein
MPLARRHLPAYARVLAIALTALLAVALLPAQSASAKAKGKLVPRQFFGLHDSDLTVWPQVTKGWSGARAGAVRLWDSGTAWRELETSPGVFDFSRLDAQVQAANRHNAEVTLVLGQTPEFQASWRAYVHAVAARYTGRPGSAGRIHALQVWNETNVIGFWSGTPFEMAKLTYFTRSEVNGVNKTLPKANRFLVLSPAFVARSNRSLLDKYWKQRYKGLTMNTLVDKVSLSLYPPAEKTPEFAIRDKSQGLAAVKAVLKKRKVTKPIWNTEINYGLMPGGSSPTDRIGTERQAAYVMRTYLLNAAAGVERVFWYAWGLQRNANTVLTNATGTPTLAGKTFGRTQQWLSKSRLTGCTVVTKGKLKDTNTCTLTYKGGVKRVIWNSSKRVKLAMPATATYSINLSGKKTSLKGGAKKFVDYRPMLVRSKR